MATNNLWDILNECSKELKEIGINHGNVIDIRYKKIETIGLCNTHTFRSYEIWVKSALFQRKHPNIDGLKYVVMHELLHTVLDCIQHGKNWIQVAQKVDQNYNYGIMGYQSEYDILHKNAPTLLKFICSNCGGYWKVKNPSTCQQVQSGHIFRCPWCGGEYKDETKM